MALVSPRFSKSELSKINKHLEASTTEDVLNWVEVLDSLGDPVPNAEITLEVLEPSGPAFTLDGVTDRLFRLLHHFHGDPKRHRSRYQWRSDLGR